MVPFCPAVGKKSHVTAGANIQIQGEAVFIVFKKKKNVDHFRGQSEALFLRDIEGETEKERD